MATFRSRGNLQWEARIRRKGYPTTCKTFDTKAEAEAWAAARESEMFRGAWVSSKEADSTTLEECLDRYAKDYLPAMKSHAREVRRISNLKKYPLVKRIMSTIRTKDIAEFRKVREEGGAGPDTVRLDFSLISRVFVIAKSDWGMESLSNPVEHATKPKLPGGRTRRLVGDEEKRLLAACQPPEFRAIVELAIATAMRRSEILGVEWDSVNLKQQTIHLADTKNSSARTVPLDERAVEILSDLPRNISGKIWDIHEDTIDKWMTKACTAAGIVGLRFHDLRHEATSRLFESTDLSDLEISEITGHKSLQSLKRYAHLRTARLVKRLNGARRGEAHA
ncbi:site-specific integrase [Solidesulfovibrio magneticus]|nr:site-specific integrase [Solidesulfovibrio magneticus]